jgi:hypothetical protein
MYLHGLAALTGVPPAHLYSTAPPTGDDCPPRRHCCVSSSPSTTLQSRSTGLSRRTGRCSLLPEPEARRTWNSARSCVFGKDSRYSCGGPSTQHRALAPVRKTPSVAWGSLEAEGGVLLPRTAAPSLLDAIGAFLIHYRVGQAQQMGRKEGLLPPSSWAGAPRDRACLPFRKTALLPRPRHRAVQCSLVSEQPRWRGLQENRYVAALPTAGGRARTGRGVVLFHRLPLLIPVDDRPLRALPGQLHVRHPRPQE